MRLLLRVLFIECALSWVLVLAGYARVAQQIWPVATAHFRGRNWRAGLGVLVGLPIVAGWPVLFLARGVAVYTGGDWLNLAIPWWLMIGTGGSLVLVVMKVNAAESRAALRTGCQCGACVARGINS